MARSYYYTFEKSLKHKLLSCSDLFDRNITTSLNIIDLSGFGMHLWTKKTMGLLKRLLSIMQDYYPESMGKLLLINAPFIFTAVYAVIKGWLDERTTKKISILGSSYMSTLSELVDDDQIPDFLGGKSTTKDRGPWDFYDLIDGPEGVGVKRKDDPNAVIITP